MFRVSLPSVAATFFVVCVMAVAVDAGAPSAIAQAADGVTATLVIDPAPAEEPLSEDFELTVNARKTPVYRCRVSAMPFNQVWPGYQRPLDQTELASFATWDMSGPVEVEVVSRRPVEAVAIRPTARGIQAKVEGNRIRFRLESAQQISVEVNGWHHALHLFANPLPEAAPNKDAAGVRYFGPGVHRPGKMVLESNQTVYLAGGAVVYGAIEAKDASNLQILGHGILDTSEFERNQAGGSIRLKNCKNITIDGVILRDPNVWCLSTFSCTNVSISNVKLIGLWRYNADGIDICNTQEVKIRNCFVRSFDDSIVLKGLGNPSESVRNVLVEGCVIWNDWGRALEIGAETAAPEMSDIVFRDCDIVRTVHVALDIQHGDRATIKNVLFDNIRLEVDDVNWRGEIQKGRDDRFAFDTKYRPQFLVMEIIRCMWSQDASRGTLDGVTVRNCSISGKPLPPSRLQGFDAEHGIRNVLISHLRRNGQTVEKLEDAEIRVGPHVQDVRIEGDGTADTHR